MTFKQPTQTEIKAKLTEILNQFPKEMIVFKTADGGEYTASQIKKEMIKDSSLGKEFIRYTMAEAKQIVETFTKEKDGI
jgi:hypothetical protein